jgi:hypothetical protein
VLGPNATYGKLGAMSGSNLLTVATRQLKGDNTHGGLFTELRRPSEEHIGMS